jgi:hypothetical protein
MISRCDPSWGGLVVIKSQNPWTYENIYFVYAHLSARELRVGQYLNTGTYVGRSGGGSGNPCRGNSTGSHLHFQIDREDGSPEPYYPPAYRLNSRDDDYAVSHRTLNPMVFIGGGYRWTFNQNGNKELWDLFNIKSWGVGNGALVVDGEFDPYIRRGGITYCGYRRPCSNMVNAEADQYKEVYLDIYNDCSSGVGKIYFTTDTSPRWDEAKTIMYLTNYGYMNAHIWVGWHPLWTGTITGIRVDPADQCSSLWDPNYFGEITIER